MCVFFTWLHTINYTYYNILYIYAFNICAFSPLLTITSPPLLHCHCHCRASLEKVLQLKAQLPGDTGAYLFFNLEKPISKIMVHHFPTCNTYVLYNSICSDFS